MTKTILVTENNYFRRLDKFLRKELDDVKLASIFTLIRKGMITVNDQKVKDPDYALQIDDRINISLPEKDRKAFLERDLEGKRKLFPRKMDIKIEWEDDHLLILNKPEGIAIHPGEGAHQKTTMLEGLMFYSQTKGFEPFLVHRLDKDTSGLLVVSKNRECARKMGELFQTHSIRKKYYALVHGDCRELNALAKISAIQIRDMLDEKEAISHIHIRELFTYKNSIYSFLEVEIETGRKHQIRRHLALRRLPIIGDTLYGDFVLNKTFKEAGFQRLFLQSYWICFLHPETKKEVSVEIPLENELTTLLSLFQPVPIGT